MTGSAKSTGIGDEFCSIVYPVAATHSISVIGNTTPRLKERGVTPSFKYSRVPNKAIRQIHRRNVQGEKTITATEMIPINSPVMLRVINSGLFKDLAIFQDRYIDHIHDGNTQGDHPPLQLITAFFIKIGDIHSGHID